MMLPSSLRDNFYTGKNTFIWIRLVTLNQCDCNKVNNPSMTASDASVWGREWSRWWGTGGGGVTLLRSCRSNMRASLNFPSIKWSFSLSVPSRPVLSSSGSRLLQGGVLKDKKGQVKRGLARFVCLQQVADKSLSSSVHTCCPRSRAVLWRTWLDLWPNDGCKNKNWNHKATTSQSLFVETRRSNCSFLLRSLKVLIGMFYKARRYFVHNMAQSIFLWMNDGAFTNGSKRF